MKGEKVSYRMVPIYGLRLMIVLTENAAQSRQARCDLFGPWEYSPCSGLASWDEGFRFALFFEKAELAHDLIAHEVFHVTHRMMERFGTRFSEQGHEPFALLCGWVSSAVYEDMEKWNAPVPLKAARRKYIRGEPKLGFTSLRSELD